MKKPEWFGPAATVAAATVAEIDSPYHGTTSSFEYKDRFKLLLSR